MKTEIERICEIMETLLAHKPIIDVPYEKINDIAVALVKEGYDNISEYKTEREMLGSQIKVLKQRLNDKYVEVDNLNRDYRNAFERLKAQEREIERLKAENKSQERENDFLKYCQCLTHGIDGSNHIKKAQIDILNKAKEKLDSAPNGWAYTGYIDELIEEVENDK